MGNEQSTLPQHSSVLRDQEIDDLNYSEFSDEENGNFSQTNLQEAACSPDLSSNNQREPSAGHAQINDKITLSTSPSQAPTNMPGNETETASISSPAKSITDSTKKRKNRKRRRTSISAHSSSLVHTTSNESSNAGVSTRVQENEVGSTRQNDVVSPETEALRQKEPETFGIYADASDSSDDENSNEITGLKTVPRRISDDTVSGIQQHVVKPKADGRQPHHPGQIVSGNDQLTLHRNSNQSAGSNQKSSPLASRKSKYPCPSWKVLKCDKTFSTELTAKQHNESAHKNTIHSCPICQKAFRRKDQMQIHLKTHAPREAVASRKEREVIGDDVEAKEDGIAEHEVDQMKHSGKRRRSEPREDLMEDSRAEAFNHMEHKIPPDTGFVPIRPRGHDDTMSMSPNSTSEGRTVLKRKRQDKANPPLVAVSSLRTNKRQRRSRFSIPCDTDDDDGDDGGELRGPVESPTELHQEGTGSQTGIFETAYREVDEGMEDEGVRSAPHRPIKSNKEIEPDDEVRGEETFVETLLPTEFQGSEAFQSQDRDRTALKTGSSSKMAKAKNYRNGTLDGFAKPITPESNSSHTFNLQGQSLPRQQVEVLVPPSPWSGPTTGLKKLKPLTENAKEALKRQPYTTPKGKGKARTGVNYKSPSTADAVFRSISHLGNGDQEEEESELDDVVATSVARRTNHKTKSSQIGRRGSQSMLSEDTEDGLGFEDDSDLDGDKPYMCEVCNQRFSEEVHLKIHKSDGKAHEHLVQCTGCSKSFVSRRSLVIHEKQTGHGAGTGDQGSTGRFTDWEVAKLDQWKDEFCERHEINAKAFNEMMTASCRRDNSSWKWDDLISVSKTDFLDEYYDQLPNRNRRSMIRYRERNFQNVDKSNWSADDDEKLEQLVKQLGPRWVKIGEKMKRTQDAVNQRWRHKLNHGLKSNTGDWTPAETEELKTAVNAVIGTNEDGRDNDDDDDELRHQKIPWELVCKKMKGARTAQQCSNKWRVLTTRRIRGKFVRVPHIDRMPGSAIKKPSRMTRRLQGKTSTSKKTPSKAREYKSEAIVVESDEDETESPTNETASAIDPFTEQAHQRVEATKDDEGNSPVTSRNPLNINTPINKLSLTQLHNGTQASASSKQANTGKKRVQLASADRPSPDVAIRSRPLSSPSRSIAENESNEDDEESSSSSSKSESDEVPEVHQDASRSNWLTQLTNMVKRIPPPSPGPHKTNPDLSQIMMKGRNMADDTSSDNDDSHK